MKETEFENKLNNIKAMSKYLKLSYSFHYAKNLLEEHTALNSSLIDFYSDILSKECDIRNENGKQSRIRLANFPYKKYLSDLKTEFLPEDAKNRLEILNTLEFIRNGQNLILAGNPGTGKTHIAIGLGIKACQGGSKYCLQVLLH